MIKVEGQSLAREKPDSETKLQPNFCLCQWNQPEQFAEPAQEKTKLISYLHK